MNLSTLQRKLERLAVLLEIRADRKEKKREDELRLRLLAILALLLANEDYQEFKRVFLLTLRESLDGLDPNGDYADLIDREISVQSGYLNKFIQDMKNDRLSEAQEQARAGQYANTLGRMRENIKLHEYPDDTRLRWTMGQNENHCSTCPSLDGQVRTALAWRGAGLFPKCSLTDCDGACLCHWEEV